MELWELVARESIRDLVARYNANGDSGRFDQVMELFAPDATMEIEGEAPKVGHDEIRTIFTGAAGRAEWGDQPVYLRHMTGTHQIDLVDEHHATGRCYYFVLTAIGLDHWGRYLDEYRVVDGTWRFAKRRVSTDGRSPDTLFGGGAVAAVGTTPDRYSHGHDESVLRSHRWRTAENSAGFLLPHLTPGQRVLDVGCGPGNITADLARRVFPGSGTGVDLAEDIVVAAARDFPPADDVHVEFAVGDVYSLDFDDASFDVVYAHQVLQHLSEPVTALREMRRVLAPGGLVAVRDGDYGAFRWTPDDPRLDRWMAIYHELTRRNGAEADAGRYLHQWVNAAGFTDLVVSSSNWTFQAPEDRAWWGGLWADRVRDSEYARQGLEYGLTTRAELDAIADAFRTWAADDDGLFIVLHGEVLARA